MEGGGRKRGKCCFHRNKSILSPSCYSFPHTFLFHYTHILYFSPWTLYRPVTWTAWPGINKYLILLKKMRVVQNSVTMPGWLLGHCDAVARVKRPRSLDFSPVFWWNWCIWSFNKVPEHNAHTRLQYFWWNHYRISQQLISERLCCTGITNDQRSGDVLYRPGVMTRSESSHADSVGICVGTTSLNSLSAPIWDTTWTYSQLLFDH